MRRHGFTLIEICLAVFIALIVITMAVPSVQRLLSEENGRKSFNRLDALARYAQSHAVSERRAYVLDWDKTGILVRPEKPANPEEKAGLGRIDVGENEVCDIVFPAALEKKPVREWIFWPTGTCESATVSYKGNGESWVAEYDSLTVQATVSNNETKNSN